MKITINYKGTEISATAVKGQDGNFNQESICDSLTDIDWEVVSDEQTDILEREMDEIEYRLWDKLYSMEREL